MLFWMKVAQAATALLLMIAILLQNRGAGLGGVFGGSGGVYMTKRGLEKKLFVVTVVLATAFLLLSLGVFLV